MRPLGAAQVGSAGGTAAGPAGRPTLAALVVTCNRLGKLRETVDALLREGPDRILVIDNDSADGTGAWLAAQRGVEVLALPENRGGAGGFEAGLRRLAAGEAPPDWIVVMDDDARPAPGAFAAFRAADLAGVDALAAAVTFPDGRVCDMNRPAVVPFWTRDAFVATLRRGRMGFHMSDADLAPGKPRRRVDFASFVGLFLSRRAVALGGYPDGRMFLYGDDTLYTMELSRAGGRILADPSVRFEHDCATMTHREGRHAPVWKVYYLQRNALQGLRPCGRMAGSHRDPGRGRQVGRQGAALRRRAARLPAALPGLARRRRHRQLRPRAAAALPPGLTAPGQAGSVASAGGARPLRGRTSP